MKTCDIAIIGGGIVGLATAYQALQRYPRAKITVIEKEPGVARHQSGNNSGVLHSGIYYRPGSLRAENCRLGKLAMEEFCRAEGIPFDLCGKVIVAVNDAERKRLRDILERGRVNGVRCELISRERLLELEPHVAGVEAIHVPEAGIINYRQVCERLAEILRESGSEILLNAEAQGIQHDSGSVSVTTTQGDVCCRLLITCGGLWADRVIALSGETPEAPIVPFRGEFFELKPEAQHLCRGLIYPVPDPSFPFLGVHFTRTIEGGVECGPNAVFAFARDGYKRTDVNFRDLYSAMTYRGFMKIALQHWRTGLGEMWRSWNKSAFVAALKRLVPEIESQHLIEAPAGVRAQALGRDGKLIDDFVIQQSERIIHVGNAPSPAATASLNIGSLVVDRIDDTLLSR